MMKKLKLLIIFSLLILHIAIKVFGDEQNQTNKPTTNSSFKRKLETKKPTTKIVKKDNPRKLYLFCKNCTLDRRLWKKLEQIFGNYLNETPYEIRPSIILSKNYTLAEKVFGITEFPAFVFVDRNETLRFDASSNPMNLTYLNFWLSSMNIEDKMELEISVLSTNVDEISQINHMNFDEKVLDSMKFWLILLKNSKHDDRLCNAYDGEHLYLVQHKLFNENSLKIHIGIMETIDYNYVFVRKRFTNIDPISDNCPVYMKILNNNYQAFNGWEYVEMNETLTEKLIEFVKEPYNEKTWEKIGVDLTDSEYMYHDLQFKIEESLKNKTFIVIGITGGISVIALAVSIFWGLKSSSFESQTKR